jgi:CRISPR-associated endonuclease/helicase Cas3
MAQPFLQCESHPGRPLVEHLLDVAARALVRGGDDPWLRGVGLFHDLGKASAFFAAHLAGRSVNGELSRHSWLGATLILHFLTMNGDAGKDNLEIALAYLAIRGHHTGLMDLVSALEAPSQREATVFNQQFSAMDLAGMSEWLRAEGFGPVEMPTLNTSWWQRRRMAVRRLLNEIVSNDNAMGRFQRALLRFGILIDADRDSAARCETTSSETPHRIISDHLSAFRSEQGFDCSKTAIQSLRGQVFTVACDKAATVPVDGGRLWTLTVPTGSGKTLAAFGWALRRREMRRAAGHPARPIIYALPFTSIIDQNAKVIREVIRTTLGEAAANEILAEHHHLADFGPRGSENHSLTRLLAESWRADIVCTSFVQVVQALFHGTPADARRFTRLAGATLILDEVQAIPVEFWPVLRQSLRSLSANFGTDILLMTATQPAIFGGEDNVTELATNELLLWNTDSFDRYDLRFETNVTLSLPTFAERVAQEIAKSGGSALVVVNTIREALELFYLFSQRNDFPQLAGHCFYHLSTNLRPKDRRVRLDELAATSSQPHLLVSTQVVEAGVDLSFDLVFRANAPIDSVVQAAGRCNRHGQGQRGKVFVVELEGETGRQIYGAVHMDVARRVTKQTLGKNFREPELKPIIDTYFQTVAADISQKKSNKVMEAVRQFEFGALRGLNCNEPEKAINLIQELANRIPHFIEIDADDSIIWQKFNEALALTDAAKRHRLLRSLRPQIARSVVEVPRHFAAKEPDATTGMVYIAKTEVGQFYNSVTGWIRNTEHHTNP